MLGTCASPAPIVTCASVRDLPPWGGDLNTFWTWPSALESFVILPYICNIMYDIYCHLKIDDDSYVYDMYIYICVYIIMMIVDATQLNSNNKIQSVI